MNELKSNPITRQKTNRNGVLLVNTGTPDAPTPEAVRRFLAEFLSDPRVVDYPRWLWLPILHAVILNVRPRRSARLYRQIWSSRSSPLLNTLELQAGGLTEKLRHLTSLEIPVAVAMRYGSPSISSGLSLLKQSGTRRVVIFPLFPQYSNTTTGSVYDAVLPEANNQDPKPGIIPVRSYYNHPAYIQALTASIRKYWAENNRPQRLLFSFHAIPARYVKRGDPYLEQCSETSWLVASELGIGRGEWGLSYQSRFGPERWTQPYTDQTLQLWAESGVKNVHVIAPGFSADCLETLYELDIEGRHIFLNAGGESFGYIPALNVLPDHINMMAQVVLESIENKLNISTSHSGSTL